MKTIKYNDKEYKLPFSVALSNEPTPGRIKRSIPLSWSLLLIDIADIPNTLKLFIKDWTLPNP